jgi:23S rRNA pseudouridine2605 synthase
MARPRKTTGGKTSFGKQSNAEKSFYQRKKTKPEGRFGESKSFSRGEGGERTGRPSRFSKGGSKPLFKRNDGEERSAGYSKSPYKKTERSDKPFGERRSSFKPRTERSDKPYGERKSSFKPRGEDARFGKKPYQKRDRDSGEEKPFRKSSSFDSRSGSSPRFEKKSFRRNDEGTEKPLKKRDSDSFDSKSERTPRFEKKPFQKRSSTRSFDSNSEKSPRFEKKPYQKRSESTGEDKPFRKSSRSFDSGSENSSRFEKKPFVKRTEDTRDGDSFRKNSPSSSESRSGRSGFVKKSYSREGDDGERSTSKSSNFGLPYKRKSFSKSKGFKAGKSTHREEKPKTDSDLIRLNKFIANSGVGSRREADELIKMGLVTVNGETITEMGYKVKITDDVRYEGRKLKAEKPVYILLNKPKGFITTTDDPQERNTVMSLVANAGNERIYPVGRLDRNTTGLLLLTNDGDLADKLTHPSYNIKKIYKVDLDRPITKGDFEKIQKGIFLEEGRAVVDELAIVTDDRKSVGIELHIGWNRIVRRIFESLGYAVEKLDRVVYAGLDKKDLARGQWRFLKPEEVVKLKHFS